MFLIQETTKNQDKVNWAKKRKSGWLAHTGKIHYVRERTVSRERAISKDDQKTIFGQNIKREAKPQNEGSYKEIPIMHVTDTEEQKDEESEEDMKPKDYWPRRKRSDITMLY